MHPKTKAWNCTFPNCGHTYTAYGNIRNHIAGSHLKPDQKEGEVKKTALIIRAKKQETLVEKEKNIFEGAFIPWQESINQWYKCTDCDGKELLDEDFIRMSSVDITDDSTNIASGSSGKQESKATNEYKDHNKQNPSHKTTKIYNCTFPLPFTTAPVQNCDRRYTDVRQMQDHVERTHYDQVKSCASYKSFLEKKVEEHKETVKKSNKGNQTKNPRGWQAIGVRPTPQPNAKPMKTLIVGSENGKPAGTKAGVRGWRQGPDGNYYRLGGLVNVSDDDDDSNDTPLTKKSSIRRLTPKERSEINLDGIDTDYYTKVSAGTYCRIVMEQDSYNHMMTKKEYIQECRQCKFSFTNVNEFWFHQPCYEERRQERLLKFNYGNNYLCENCGKNTYRSYDDLLKHRHHDPQFSCNDCDHWSLTQDYAIIHTQVGYCLTN